MEPDARAVSPHWRWQGASGPRPPLSTGGGEWQHSSGHEAGVPGPLYAGPPESDQMMSPPWPPRDGYHELPQMSPQVAYMSDGDDSLMLESDHSGDGEDDETGSIIEFGSLPSQIEFDSLEEEVRQRRRWRQARALPYGADGGRGDEDDEVPISRRRPSRPSRFHDPLIDEIDALPPPPPIRDIHTRPGSPPRPEGIDFDRVQDFIMPDPYKPTSPLSSGYTWTSWQSPRIGSTSTSASPRSDAPSTSKDKMADDAGDVTLGPCLHLPVAGQPSPPPTAPCSYLQPGAVFYGKQTSTALPDHPSIAEAKRRRQRKRRSSAPQHESAPVPSSSIDRLPAIRRVNASVDPVPRPFSPTSAATTAPPRRPPPTSSRDSDRRWSPSAPFSSLPDPRPLPPWYANLPVVDVRPRSERATDSTANSRRIPLPSGTMTTRMTRTRYRGAEWDTEEETTVEEVSPPAMTARTTSWDVRVHVHAVDLARGRIEGIMHALRIQVEGSDEVLPCTTTAFDGEIIDGRNHGLLGRHRRGGEQGDEEDARHWASLEPFSGRGEQGVKTGRPKEGYILVRLKERGFVNVDASDSGLTIDGVYHCALNRTTGHVDALYVDPASCSQQRLCLTPAISSSGARPFASFTMG